MIFDPEIYCTAAETRELDGKDAVTLAGAGLWAGVLSRGECLLEGLARPGQSGDISGDRRMPDEKDLTEEKLQGLFLCHRKGDILWNHHLFMRPRAGPW